jgi:DNA-binding transcriptional MerR regulator
MENRITIEELMKRYKVSERTLRTWKETKGLPLREITPQNKWVYENELKKWENSFI